MLVCGLSLKWCECFLSPYRSQSKPPPQQRPRPPLPRHPRPKKQQQNPAVRKTHPLRKKRKPLPARNPNQVTFFIFLMSLPYPKNLISGYCQDGGFCMKLLAVSNYHDNSSVWNIKSSNGHFSVFGGGSSHQIGSSTPTLKCSLQKIFSTPRNTQPTGAFRVQLSEL